MYVCVCYNMVTAASLIKYAVHFTAEFPNVELELIVSIFYSYYSLHVLCKE